MSKGETFWILSHSLPQPGQNRGKKSTTSSALYDMHFAAFPKEGPFPAMGLSRAAGPSRAPMGEMTVPGVLDRIFWSKDFQGFRALGGLETGNLQTGTLTFEDFSDIFVFVHFHFSL